MRNKYEISIYLFIGVKKKRMRDIISKVKGSLASESEKVQSCEEGLGELLVN
jgi:hypothetical protein